MAKPTIKTTGGKTRAPKGGPGRLKAMKKLPSHNPGPLGEGKPTGGGKVRREPFR